MQPGTFFGEAAEDDFRDTGRGRQGADDGGYRDMHGPFGGKSIDPCGDRRKRHRRQAMILTKLERAPIARRQRFVLTPAAAMPNRSDGVDDVPGGKPVTLSDLGVAGGAAAEAAAFGQQLRPGGAMDCAIDAAAPEQRFIGGVDNGVNVQGGDVGDDDFKPCRADLARRQRQAEAGAALTPFSVSSCCSSPAWNISRMMSQPPTNSPLT
jgi:hypothetical protein